MPYALHAMPFHSSPNQHNSDHSSNVGKYQERPPRHTLAFCFLRNAWTSRVQRVSQAPSKSHCRNLEWCVWQTQRCASKSCPNPTEQCLETRHFGLYDVSVLVLCWLTIIWFEWLMKITKKTTISSIISLCPKWPGFWFTALEKSNCWNSGNHQRHFLGIPWILRRHGRHRSTSIKKQTCVFLFSPCTRWQLQTKLLYNWDITIKSCNCS